MKTYPLELHPFYISNREYLALPPQHLEEVYRFDSSAKGLRAVLDHFALTLEPPDSLNDHELYEVYRDALNGVISVADDTETVTRTVIEALDEYIEKNGVSFR